MSERIQNMPEDTILQSIDLALEACYGDLAQPDFRKIYTNMEGSAYCQVGEGLQSEGIQVNDSTDLNDDVAIHIGVNQDGEGGWVALSGVGPFAAFIWHDRNGQYSWVTQPGNAPSPLAASVAKIVEGAGFALLGRNIVTQTIAMNRADGTTEATLYQALFTDSDVIP